MFGFDHSIINLWNQFIINKLYRDIQNQWNKYLQKNKSAAASKYI